MSLAALMVRDITILRAVTSTDRYGNVQADNWTHATTTATKAWVSQRFEGEELDGRNAQIRDWVAFLPAGTVIDGGDRVRCDGMTFEVIGPPHRAWRPSGEHHVEAQLRAVQG